MKRRKHILAVMTAMVIVLALATVAMAGDPFVGTWKLNVAKSKYSPGSGNKSRTVKMEAQENGLKVVDDSVDAKGKSTHAEWTAKYDGKDYSIKGNPDVDTISLTKIDASTVDYVVKKSGKEMEGGRSVVSKDGKTWTLAGKGKDAKGQNIVYTEVFDKQ